MSFEVKGKLLSKGATQSGASKNGGTWEKGDFLVEIPGQYPKKINFTVWGDVISAVASIPDGQEINVFFDIESREYQGRYYTDVKAWKVAGLGAGTSSDATNNNSAGGYTPSGADEYSASSSNNAPSSNNSYTPEVIEDDLPF